MKLIPSGALAGISSILIGLLAGAEAKAQNFGVNFVGNTSDLVTGTAGVVPIANWNNINGATFTSGSILGDDGVTSINLSLTGAATAGSWHSGATSDGGNGSLMNGYVDAGANNGGGVSVVSTLSGLSGSLYNVFIYNYSDASHPGNGGDWLSSYSINGTSIFSAQLGNGTSTYNSTSTAVGGPFNSFVRATAFGANFNTQTLTVSDFGNYIEIDNVAPVSGVITIASESDNQSWRSPLNGFEIVAVPEPTTLALSLAGLAALGLVRRRNK